MSEISSDIPDWNREKPTKFWDPGRKLLRSIRRYQKIKDMGGIFSGLQLKYWVLIHRFWSVVCGAEIDLSCKIGGGLLIPHPNGIVIHPGAIIGPNCLLFQQVTIGAIDGAIPKLGGHVDVGAGAKILGGVTLGNHTIIGANAVVIRDVADGQTVVGIPAKPTKPIA